MTLFIINKLFRNVVKQAVLLIEQDENPPKAIAPMPASEFFFIKLRLE